MDMYRIRKVLNHNTVIVIRTDDTQECMIVGKGIGFGKRVSEYVEPGKGDTVYSLQELTERGNAGELVKSVSPECLEIANEVLNEAERAFGKIDRNILFPMADHLEFAVRRIRNHEQISNPLTDDISVLFHKEFKAAHCVVGILKEKMNIDINDDEVGYIALHIHSALGDEKISEAMQMARAVRACITMVEEETHEPIDVMSLSYNRLMNHVRFMFARAMAGEKLQVNINDYMEIKFPESYQTAKKVCAQIGELLKRPLQETEIGYLAMHIERVHEEKYPVQTEK